MTEATPDVAVGLIDLENSAQVFNGCWKGIFGAQDACDALHSWHRPLIEFQGLLVALHSTVIVLHLLRKGAHLSPHSLGQLPQVLRRCLGLVRVRRVSIHLRVRRMLPNMV
jgi:hypothetical protein